MNILFFLILLEYLNTYEGLFILIKKKCLTMLSPIDRRKMAESTTGILSFKGTRYFVGNPFGGYNIGIFITDAGRFDVWFGESYLGCFDRETLLLIPDKAYTLMKGKESITCVLGSDRQCV